MAFLILMLAVSALAYLPLLLRGRSGEWRTPMRVGMAGAFLFTGLDHFVSLETRYLPMIPDYLAPWGADLVAVSGALELAGAVGLLVPPAVWRRLGLPDLRPVAGVGLAMLLSVMVIANGHVAATTGEVAGLAFGPGYAVVRPFLQPFILLWALVASEAVFPRRPASGAARA